MDDDVEVVLGAEDALAQVAGLVGVRDGLLQPADHMQHLTAHVDEGVMGAHRIGADDDALDQRVRGRH